MMVVEEISNSLFSSSSLSWMFHPVLMQWLNSPNLFIRSRGHSQRLAAGKCLLVSSFFCALFKTFASFKLLTLNIQEKRRKQGKRMIHLFLCFCCESVTPPEPKRPVEWVTAAVGASAVHQQLAGGATWRGGLFKPLNRAAASSFRDRNCSSRLLETSLQLLSSWDWNLWNTKWSWSCLVTMKKDHFRSIVHFSNSGQKDLSSCSPTSNKCCLFFPYLLGLFDVCERFNVWCQKAPLF